jgi:4-amino-4-deoxy-L-arabinose transferase-like glycosyltransferase
MESRQWICAEPSGLRHRQMDLLLVGIAGLVVIALAGWPVEQPGTMDSHYYYGGGQSLLENRAFIEPYIWNYLDPVPSLPAPSHLYWMPLPSILVAGSQALLGSTFKAAQVPFLLLGAALPIISYLVSWTLSHNRRHALLAGGLTIFSGFYLPYWALPETFAPFAVVGSLALFTTGKGITQKKPIWLLAAGILAGLGHLCRADGVLLIGIAILSVLVSGWRKVSLRSTGFALVLAISGYLLVMTPWFVRNWHVIGAPLPTAGTKTIFLRDYNELFGFGTPLTLERYLKWGWRNILGSKLSAAWTNLQTFVAVNNLIFLTPLTLIGLWQLRRRLLIWPAFVYGLALYSAMTLVFTFPGARGGVFHSSAALLPFLFSAAIVGLDTTIDWTAQRRQRWRQEGARRFFSLGLLLLAASLSAFLYNQRVIGNGTWHDPAWNRTDSAMTQVGEWLETQSEDAPIVMVGNPPAFHYHTGLLAVVAPNENVRQTLTAAWKYGVRYLILDKNCPPPLSDLCHGHEYYPGLELVWDPVRGAPEGVVIYQLLEP